MAKTRIASILLFTCIVTLLFIFHESTKYRFDERILFEKNVSEIMSDLIMARHEKDDEKFFRFIPYSMKSFLVNIANQNSKENILKKVFYKIYKVMVLDYVTWHRDIISKVKNNELNGTKVRTVVFIGNDGNHGLGDMFRGILFSYISAVFSKRIFLLKGYCPFPLREFFQNSHYSNFTYDEQFFPLTLNSTGIHGKARIEEQNIFLGNETQIRFETESEPRFETLWENIDSNKYENFSIASSLNEAKLTLTKIGEELHVEEVYPFIFKGLFQITEEVRNTIRDYVEEIGKNNIENPYVSIHVRLGKGIGEDDKRRFGKIFEKLSIESYADCLAEKAVSFSYSLGINPPRFFLATDTPEFRNHFEESVVQLNKKSIVMHTRGKLKHVNKLQESNEGDVDIIRSTFLEIFLLSKGKGIMKSRSGFANVAKWMGGIEKYIFYEVHHCY